MGLCASADDDSDDELNQTFVPPHVDNNPNAVIPKFCLQCGTKTEPTNKFCSACGAPYIRNNNNNNSSGLNKSRANSTQNKRGSINYDNVLLSAKDLGMHFELDLEKDVAAPSGSTNSQNKRESALLPAGEIQIQVLIEEEDEIDLDQLNTAQFVQGNGYVKPDPHDYTATVFDGSMLDLTNAISNNTNEPNSITSPPSSATNNSSSGLPAVVPFNNKNLERVASRAHRLKQAPPPRPSKLSSLRINKQGTLTITRTQAQQLASQKILIFTDYDPNKLETPHHADKRDSLPNLEKIVENKAEKTNSAATSPLSPESPADLPIVSGTRPRSIVGQDLASATTALNQNNNKGTNSTRSSLNNVATSSAKSSLSAPPIPDKRGSGVSNNALLSHETKDNKSSVIFPSSRVGPGPSHPKPKYRVATLKLNKAGTLKMEQAIEQQTKIQITQANDKSNNNTNNSNNNMNSNINIQNSNNLAAPNNNNPVKSLAPLSTTPTSKSGTDLPSPLLSSGNYPAARLYPTPSHSQSRRSVPSLSPCTVTHLRCELAPIGHGVLFHITGTKPSSLFVYQAWLDLHGEDFWNCIAEDQAWAIRMAIKIFRRRMPLKLCPKKMNRNDYMQGTEEFHTTIAFGTDNKGMNSQLTGDRIKKSLHKFATSKQYPNPPILIQVRYTDDPNNDQYEEINEDELEKQQDQVLEQALNNNNNNNVIGHQRTDSMSQFTPIGSHTRQRSILSASNNSNPTRLGKPLFQMFVTPQQLLDTIESSQPIVFGPSK